MVGNKLCKHILPTKAIVRDIWWVKNGIFGGLNIKKLELSVDFAKKIPTGCMEIVIS